MSRWNRAGRVDLASLLAGVAGGAVVALVVFFLFPGPGRAPDAGVQREASGTLQPTPNLSGLEASLARLEQRLGSIESALRSRASPSERAPVPVPEGDVATTPLTESQELQDELRQLCDRVDALALAWKEHSKQSFEVPSLQQIHSARRDVDWAWLGELAELYLRDADAAQEKARLLTFDQLLKRAGVPTKISTVDGLWMYLRPEHLQVPWRGVYFNFVGDCVSSMRTDP